MGNKQDIDWFGVRAIYLFGRSHDGRSIFEERICVFSGESADEALKKAQAEADEYAVVIKGTCHEMLVSYLQDGETLIDGYEVWSELFSFDGDLDSFVRERYDRFHYDSDTDGPTLA